MEIRLGFTLYNMNRSTIRLKIGTGVEGGFGYSNSLHDEWKSQRDRRFKTSPEIFFSLEFTVRLERPEVQKDPEKKTLKKYRNDS